MYVRYFVICWLIILSKAKEDCPKVPRDCKEKCVKYGWNKLKKCSTCQCVSHDGLFETDIMLDQDSKNIVKDLLNNKKKAGGADRRKWFMQRNGDNWEIPYYIDRNLPTAARNAITEAIEDFNRYTCLRFVPKSFGQQKYIYFFVSSGCWSYVGVRSSGVNLLSIGTGCEHKGIVIHELMHAIGFWHEQSRPDRDNHITIVWSNIRRGKENNFQKMYNIESYDSPYDTYSVMHYKGTAFSRNGQATIMKADGTSFTEFQRDGFVLSDIKQVNAMYQCAESVYGMTTIATFTTDKQTTDSQIETTMESLTTTDKLTQGFTTAGQVTTEEDQSGFTTAGQVTTEEDQSDFTTTTISLPTTGIEIPDSTPHRHTTLFPTTTDKQTTEFMRGVTTIATITTDKQTTDFTTQEFTTAIPCVDLWRQRKCKKMKKNEKCGKSNVMAACRKTCEICI